jgi:hypothetical protein
MHPCWVRLGIPPAATIEKAIPLLVEAINAGRVLHYRPTLKKGLSKKVWLLPERSQFSKSSVTKRDYGGPR